MNKTIHKKILSNFFNDILYRNKRFEIRKDENNIQPDDYLILAEWNPLTDQYTGRSLHCLVQYVFRGDNYVDDFGIKPGYCVIGFVLEEFKIF